MTDWVELGEWASCFCGGKVAGQADPKTCTIKVGAKCRCEACGAEGKTILNPAVAWTSKPDRVMWVQGETLWHRSVEADGLRVLCGAGIPGAPMVVRESNNSTPTRGTRCPLCEEIAGKWETVGAPARRDDGMGRPPEGEGPKLKSPSVYLKEEP